MSKHKSSIATSKLSHYANTILTKYLGLSKIVKVGGIKFFCPTFMEVWRAETLYLKEPETIDWIDSFDPHSVFWDFGANVGTYSVYAASKGHFVVCFEPSSREFEILKRNLELNHSWADAKKVYAGDDTDYSDVAKPDYIKIDTDGADIAILKGLRTIIGSVKGILIEIDPEYRERIFCMMKLYGFSLKSEQQSEMIKNSPYSKYTSGIFSKEEDIIKISPHPDTHKRDEP